MSALSPEAPVSEVSPSIFPAPLPAANAAPAPITGLCTTLRQIIATGTLGAAYTVHGWLRSCRSSKHVCFLAVNDGSCMASLQAVVSTELAGYAELLPRLTTGTAVRLQGTLVASRGKGQAVELHVQEVEVLGEADAQAYPLQKKGHTLEFLRGIAHLRPRSNTFGAVFRVRHVLAQATHKFFSQHDFAYVHTPIITASDCEGAGEMFEVVTKQKGAEFFGRPASLTVSGQLNGEALAYGLGRIYTFGPTFRAENSNTVRHLSEFWMVEPEMAFCTLQGNCALAEAYLQHCVSAVLQHCQNDLDFLQERFDKALLPTLQGVLQAPFARLPYTEAIALLQQSGRRFDVLPTWGTDLQTEHERYLVEDHFAVPVIVTDYPRDIKAFYMYQNDDDRTVAAMDVLVPRIGEMIGGSQREHRLDRLTARLQQMGMNLDSYQWYLDLARYGAAPHAGFGLGFERLVMFCTGMTNIRDVIPFPRAPGNAAY
jgi:asparaginyl-tRNA synthetase